MNPKSLDKNKTNKAEWGETKYGFKNLGTGYAVDVWAKMNDQIQESKLTIGDAYRMSSTLAEELNKLLPELLSSERQRIIEKIDGMKKNIPERLAVDSIEWILVTFNHGYNQALTDILSAIRKEDK